MRFWVTLLSIYIFWVNVFGQQTPPVHHLDPYNPEYAPKIVLIKFKDESSFKQSFLKGSKQNTGIASIDKLNQRIEMESMEKVFKGKQKSLQNRFFKDPAGNVYEVPSLDKIYKIKYKATLDAKDVAKMFAKDPNVEYAEPDYYVYMMGRPGEESTSSPPGKFPKPANTYPDDPLYQSGDQWYIDAVNAPAAWDSTTGDTSQVIGIIDTGVDWHHPDLDSKIWINKVELNGVAGVDDDGNGFVDDIRGWDFVNNDNDPMDDNSHGTHVAGIAAAETNNGVGIAGIAWGARIMPVKMLQSSGRGNSSDLAAAINYAAQNGATVINMSLGSYGESLTVKEALEYAYSTSVLVAAAGNDGLSLLQEGFPAGNMYPACYPFVIGVQATIPGGVLASFSNYDPSGSIEFTNQWGYNYEIKAPGVNIWSTFPNGGYHMLNGTSMASPIVAGAVALMKSFNPTQSTEEIFARLIQGSNNNVLDIGKSLNYQLVPDLYYVTYSLVDTLPGDDRDGIPDAGETIELYVTIKNGGGLADSVWSTIRFAPFEDTTTANIVDSTSLIGNISAYAKLTGQNDPFRIHISNGIANNRDIKFDVSFSCKNKLEIKHQTIILTASNGQELSGVMDSTLTLDPSKLWVINNSFRIGSNGVLIIQQGTHLKLNLTVSNHGKIIANGDKNNPVIIDGPGNFLGSGYYYFKYTHFNNINVRFGSDSYSAKKMEFYYSVFNGIDLLNLPFSQQSPMFALIDTLIIKNSVISNSLYRDLFAAVYNTFFEYNNIINCTIDNGGAFKWMQYFQENKYNNFVNPNSFYGKRVGALVDLGNDLGYRNNFIAFGKKNVYAFIATGTGDILKAPNIYWGTINENKIKETIYDFWDDATLPMVDYKPFLTQPSDSAHGIVWQVLINGKNPMDELVDPIGNGTVRFDVYFNRAMDTTYTPFLTFGVREPYTQHVVKDSTRWSADSTIWTAYYTVGLETGDGINTIRVANARDNEGFEIPVEDQRFKFVIQAAGAAATDFIATAGIGKVDLAWPPAESPDVLGYNMYRIMKLTDSTFTDTVRINNELITDSVYTDYSIIPDSTYRYAYKVLGTDMVESDFSKWITATPFNASPGDANGDLTVNVLDITTIVSYLLNQNPQPFIFDAADVNSDGQVNVLDIVAVVNIVMGGGQMQKITASHESNQRMIFSYNGVRLENAGDIAALQLIAVGKNLSRDNIQPGQLLKRMEYAFHVRNDTLYLVVYNLKNAGFSEDRGELFTITKGEIKKVASVQAANGSGQFLNIEMGGAEEIIPQNYALLQNYPNPFNPTTTIRYALPERQDVKIEIYNILGQKIRTFEIKNQPAGYHKVVWNGRNQNNRTVATGLYIYRIKAGDFIASKKMLLIR